MAKLLLSLRGSSLRALFCVNLVLSSLYYLKWMSSVGVGGRFLQNDQSVVFDSNILQATKQCSAVTENESVAHLKYLDFKNWNSLFYGNSDINTKGSIATRKYLQIPLILKASNMAMCSTHARKFFSCALHLRFIKQTSRNIWSRTGQRIVEAD